MSSKEAHYSSEEAHYSSEEAHFSSEEAHLVSSEEACFDSSEEAELFYFSSAFEFQPSARSIHHSWQFANVDVRFYIEKSSCFCLRTICLQSVVFQSHKERTMDKCKFEILTRNYLKNFNPHVLRKQGTNR